MAVDGSLRAGSAGSRTNHVGRGPGAVAPIGTVHNGWDDSDPTYCRCTAVGGIVRTLPRTPGCRDLRRQHREWVAVATLTMIVIGFAMALALVVALARTSTAPWEDARTCASKTPIVAARRSAAELPERAPQG